MRPLVIFTGQGIARADGFNLTRRAKALPPLRGQAERLRQIDRQNLDALLELVVQQNAVPAAQLVSSIRALCLKERRSTLNKQAHHDVLDAVAEGSKDRLVLHLTANLDGLTTTFLVRDFGGRWAPFHGPCGFEAVEAEAREVLRDGRGLLHFPLHGEVGLYLCGRERQQLTTAYHHPAAIGDGEPWVSTLIEGPGQGLRDVETRLSTSRLALELMQSLLRGERASLEGAGDPAGRLPADLLVIGYGAGRQGARADNPFERTIARLAREDPARSAGRWRALLYRPEEARRTSRWYESLGFRVVGYDDGDLAPMVRDQLLATRRDERMRQARRSDPRLHARG